MRAIVVATAAAVALVAALPRPGRSVVRAGKVRRPVCHARLAKPGGFQEVAEQIVLSGLDGAACELGVSREEIVLAFAGGESLQTFAREQGIEVSELEDLLRAGLVRAVDDAEQADAVNSTVAGILRQVIERVPVSTILDLLKQLPSL